MNEQEHEAEPQASLVERVEDLATILQNSSVGEIALTEGGTEIVIKRQMGEEEAVVSAPRPEQRVEHAGNVPPDSSPKGDQSVAIPAPLSGIFYASPSPDAPPFVNVGDMIQSEQVIALIEAMKVFNEIRPDVAGRLTQIGAENGALVKKGDVLFRIEPV